MPPSSARTLRLACIPAGLVIFGVGAAFLSITALVGVGLSAFGAITFTWLSLGPRRVLTALGGGAVGALVAWVAMRLMMRWVATSSGISPVFTTTGTLAILGSSFLMSILPAMGYVHYRNRFKPSYRNSLLYGLTLSLVGGIPLVILLLSEVNSIAREPGIPVAFLLGVPVLFALVLETTHRTLSNHTPIATQ